MSHAPDADFAYHLDSNSTAVTLSTNLFVGPVREESPGGTPLPRECVWVQSYGGGPADRVLGVGTELRYPRVQVRVRSSGYASGMALARSIINTMQSATPSTGNAYKDVVALQSEPVYLEQDKNMNYHWSVNFRMMYQTT